MLSQVLIRQRSRDLEDRPRGASPRSRSGSIYWRQALTRVVDQLPWSHLGLALTVALVAGSLPWLSSQALDALDRHFTRFSVEGELHALERSDIEQRLRPWLGKSFFASDLEQVKVAVEQEPWVDTAAVRRVWPGGLAVEVVEHEPVAYWNQESLVTRSGDVIRPDSVASAGALPQLSGPTERVAEVMATARDLSRRLAADDLRLAALTQEDRGAWTLTLDNGIAVQLGRDRTAERLERFLTVYRSQLSVRASEVAGVDARYSNGIAVRWKDSGQENI